MIGLKYDDEGEEVKALQYVLADAGFDPGEKDGIYKSMTASAVLRMRKSVGSNVTDGNNFTAAAYAQLLRALIKNQAKGVKGDRGPEGPAGRDGRNGKDGTLKLPATVEITGQVTSYKAD